MSVKRCVCWRGRNAADRRARDIVYAGVAAARRHPAGCGILEAAASAGLEHAVGMAWKLAHNHSTFLQKTFEKECAPLFQIRDAYSKNDYCLNKASKIYGSDVACLLYKEKL